jgi:hypothetical protein
LSFSGAVLRIERSNSGNSGNAINSIIIFRYMVWCLMGRLDTRSVRQLTPNVRETPVDSPYITLIHRIMLGILLGGERL